MKPLVLIVLVLLTYQVGRIANSLHQIAAAQETLASPPK